MKKLSFLTLVLFVYTNLDAQLLDRLSIELVIGGQSREQGLFKSSDSYSSQFNLFNGFNLVYGQDEMLNFHIGFRSFHSNIDELGGFEGEGSKTKGFEVRAGSKYAIINEKRFRLRAGAELFTEITKVDGLYFIDAGPPFYYEMDHRRLYFGVAPNVSMELKLLDRVCFFAEARCRIGSVSENGIGEVKEGFTETLPNSSYRKTEFQPFNSFGIRFDL